MNAQNSDESDFSRQLTKPVESEPMPATGLPTLSDTGIESASKSQAAADTTVVGEYSSTAEAFGKYQLVAEVMRGGMGVVFKARDPNGVIVALKTVRRDRAGGSEFAVRFAREIHAVQQLKHLNVIPILDVGEANGLPFFTMEFAQQGSLSQHRARFQNDPRAAVQLLEQVARGVQHAHEHGVLHRDLKPGNILLADDGTPRVSDFGLAKIAGSEADLTRTGQLLGTTAYMAPEQAMGRVHEIGPHSDVWSLGVILYELLAGRRPFQADDDVVLIQQIQNEMPTAPSKLCPGVASPLEAVVLKCLQKKPDQRYESVKDLADDLARWLAGRLPTLGRRSLPRRVFRSVIRHPWISAACLLLAAAAVAVPFVAPRFDPQRVRRDFEEKLARGEKVEWIPEKGLPKYPAKLLISDSSKESTTADGYFSLSDTGVCLFEFVPELKLDRYRIHGWVRQDDNIEDGCAGFYFAYSKLVDDTKTKHFFMTFEFAEIQVLAGQVRHEFRQLTEQNDGTSAWNTAGTLTRHIIPKNERKTKTWRELSVEVSPDQVVASFDGKVLPLTPKKMRDLMKGRLLKFQPNLNPPPAFSPRDGVGVFVYRGSACFKSVTIEPIRE